MNKYIIIFLLLTVGTISPSFSQDFEDDIELLEEAEDIPPPADMPPGDFEGDMAGDFDQPIDTDMPPPEPPEPMNQRPPSPPQRNRFRSAPSNSFSRSKPGGFSRGAPKSSVPKITENKQGATNIPFADANPEDITNANYPDIVESFDYKDAPLADVVSAMARLTGKNLIIDNGLNGKITIIAPRKVTVAEAWEAFLSALAMNDFTIVPSGKFLKIRKINDAKTDSIETYTGAYYPNGDQLITRIMRLKYINAGDFQKTFDRVIKSKSGQLVAYEKTNSLIITDLGSSVERISRIVEELDKPGFEEQLAVIPIKNAKAKDIAELIDKIINKGEDENKRRSFRPASRFNRGDEKDESLSLVSPDDRTNSIIVVGNSQGISRIRKLVNQLDYPLDAADAGTVHVYYVRHGEAKKIEETIMGIAQEAEKKAQSASKGDSSNPASFKPPQKQQQIFGGDVVIKADENTNSLIVTASRQDYKIVLDLLEKIDIPKDQVYVQAYIIEMAAGGADNWEAGVMKFLGAEPQGSATQGDNGVARVGYSFGGVTKLMNPASEGTLLTFGSKDIVNVKFDGQDIQVPDLLGFINLLKTQTDANVLSTPQIMAMDNEESVIEVGDEVPVSLQTNATAAGGQLGTTAQFKDATIKLKIKPFISPESDVVRMEIEQQANSVSARQVQAEQLAEISQGLTKRTIKTNLTLKSGETAVLGGLMQDSDSITEKKIPILGDIPVLGWLFKSRTVERRKTNLLVFLTPKIIRSAGDHKKLTRNKLNERIDWVKKNAKGRDPFGESLAGLVKYADAPDEFQFEDTNVIDANPAPVIDQPIDESPIDESELDDLEGIEF